MRRRKWDAAYPGWPGAAIAGVYTLLGAGMTLQPERYNYTRPYANLVEILPIRTWGLLYLAVAILFAVYSIGSQHALVAVVAHTAGFILTSAWLVAFLVQWHSDDLTTSTNAVSWLMFLAVILRSTLLVPLKNERYVADPEVPAS